MSLPANLTTNEVKNAAGTEVEFDRLATVDRSVTFAKVGEVPNLPVRLKVSHQETGSGVNGRRRSVVRVDLSNTGFDSITTVTTSCYIVLDIPIGAVSSFSDAKDAVAYIMSFVASLGASTTILYDGTGNGASALINGSL